MRKLSLISLLLFTACHKPVAAEHPPEDQLWIGAEEFSQGRAKIETAGKQEIPQAVSAAGRIAFDEQRVAHVIPSVSGRVTRLLAQLGQRVHKGSPLAAIVSPDVGTAFSDEAKARADVAAALRDFQRQQRLLADKAASGRDFEAAEDTYVKAQAEEQRALQRLRLLKEGKIDSVTQEYTLLSPIDGFVVARMVNPGMYIQGQYSGRADRRDLYHRQYRLGVAVRRCG